MADLNILGIEYRIPNKSKPHQIYICCPLCEKNGKTPDTKFKMGVDLKRKLYHCYRCGAKTSDQGSSFNSLLMLTEFAATPPAPDLVSLKEKINRIGTNQSSGMTLDLDEFSWPMNKEKTPFAYEYMINVRRFTDSQIERYQLRVGKDYVDRQTGRTIKRWSGRVIFPFYENDVPIFAVGRSYNGKEPKYLNSFGDKGLAVYGIDNVNGTAILCEGIISSIATENAVGIPAVAILGKVPTDIQLMKLRSRCNTVYKSLDGGLTPEENFKVRKKLEEHGFTVYEVLLPGESDPDDLGSEYKRYFDISKRVSLF